MFSHLTLQAHGLTFVGTQAGDFAEAQAIGNAFGRARSSQHPLIVGSVKTNVGHCESASGLASIIKAVHILESGTIPPNLNYTKTNERIVLEDLNLRVSLLPDTCNHGD